MTLVNTLVFVILEVGFLRSLFELGVNLILLGQNIILLFYIKPTFGNAWFQWQKYFEVKKDDKTKQFMKNLILKCIWRSSEYDMILCITIM